MQNTNSKRLNPTSAAAKGRKFVNSSLSSNSPIGMPPRHTNQTTMHCRKNLKDCISPGKSVQFVSKPPRPDSKGDNMVFVHKANEDYAQYIKQKFSQSKFGNASQRKTNSSKQIPTLSHKAAKEYVMDLLNPFDPGQIITTAGKYTERRPKNMATAVQSPSPPAPTGVASRVYTTIIGRHPVSKPTQMTFEGFPKAGDYIQNMPGIPGHSRDEEGIKKHEGRSTASELIGQKASMEESKTTDTGTQLEQSMNSSMTRLKLDKRECQCKCKRDPKLPYCSRAADWLKRLYRDTFEFDKYKKLYDV